MSLPTAVRAVRGSAPSPVPWTTCTSGGHCSDSCCGYQSCATSSNSSPTHPALNPEQFRAIRGCQRQDQIDDVVTQSRPEALMFLTHRPSRLAIERFIVESRDMPLSYAPVGLLGDVPAGYDADETVVTIGRGRADFERACAAIAAWKPFEIGWVELHPRDALIEPGTVVAVLIRHLGFWSLNGSRVVYGVGDRHGATRFGFAYGTLTNHAESGEERFEVSLDPVSGDVVYRIAAASRPRAIMTRIGYPITRFLQARFRRDSVEAMRNAVRAVPPAVG